MQTSQKVNVQHPSFPAVGEVRPPSAGRRRPPPAKTVNLAGIDLNLLVALEALLAERSVTCAASRVGLSQPAMSRALGRLRGLFKDELLVRSSSGLVLTARSEQLAAELPHVLNGLRSVLAARDGAPEHWTGMVSLALPDHQALVLLPSLLPRLRLRAPGVDVTTTPLGGRMLRDLESGAVDFAVGQLKSKPFGFYRRTLFVDRFACLLRSDHPAIRDGAGAPDTLVDLRQVAIAPAVTEESALVHDTLVMLDLPGRDPLPVPDTLTAALLVAETDMMLTVPRRTALRLARMLPLAVLEPPVALPDYDVALIWHERHHRDPHFTWLRSELAAAVLAVAERSDRAQSLVDA